VSAVIAHDGAGAYREVPLDSRRAHRMLDRRLPLALPRAAEVSADPWTFHRSLPDYRPTPCIDLSEVTPELGVERLWVKDETERLGLPAFKVLGASWATLRILGERFGTYPDELTWPTRRLLQELAHGPRLRHVTASAGNHGHAVARTARMFGCACHILLPRVTPQDRVDAIESEGASVEIWAGSYDDAVKEAAQRAEADDRTIVLADTAWDGYTRIPRLVSDGYSTIFRELDEQLEAEPDVVFVQVGVGALATAVLTHYAPRGIAVVAVEPLTAACAFASAAAGTSTLVPGPHPSVMTGLNAGVVSPVAMPYLLGGVTAFCAISDEAATAAAALLAGQGIAASETGAAGLAGLMIATRERLDPPTWRRPLVIVTERRAVDADRHWRR
jgi:diaminopropionate ammonia-lyase